MTAVLENVNKFSYLGLRRRPTYNEVIGLIKENEALANPLPNRDATFFKASNEGSFFDGLDHLEVLKEQQQRILQRQVQDLLLRQNVRQNGWTYHLERHRQQSSSDTSSSSTPLSIGEDRGTLSAGVQADLLKFEGIPSTTSKRRVTPHKQDKSKILFDLSQAQQRNEVKDPTLFGRELLRLRVQTNTTTIYNASVYRGAVN